MEAANKLRFAGFRERVSGRRGAFTIRDLGRLWVGVFGAAKVEAESEPSEAGAAEEGTVEVVVVEKKGTPRTFESERFETTNCFFSSLLLV
jgi:hypothetical protein